MCNIDTISPISFKPLKQILVCQLKLVGNPSLVELLFAFLNK